MIRDVVAPRVVYLLVLMVAFLLVQKLAQMVVLIRLAGGIFEGVFFQQAKALMKSDALKQALGSRQTDGQGGAPAGMCLTAR